MIFLVIGIIIVFLWYIRNVYLKEFIEVSTIFRSLRKILDSRDLLLLKIIPDIKNRKIKEKVITLISERNTNAKISFDEMIKSDAKLHNELKEVYKIVNEMKKDELQMEIFKRLITLEGQLKDVRKKYSYAVERYNMSLTIHKKFCVKFLKMRPLELYEKRKAK